MDCDEEELKATKNREKKCEYCGKKEENIQELYDKKCFSEIFHNFFRVNLQIYGSSVQRVFRINYCPMCR
jgi:hypothetical protein